MKKIGAFLAAVAVTGATAAYAQSQPGIYIKHTYYERVAGEGDPVAYWILYCDNSVQANGYPTQYVVEEHYDC